MFNVEEGIPREKIAEKLNFDEFCKYFHIKFDHIKNQENIERELFKLI